MESVELLDRLSRLRRAQVGAVRVPHKPLLLLWLFGRVASTGSSVASYADAEEPVSGLINQFGPPVRRATARQRAAMPFVHLERELWDLRDATGGRLGPDVPERRRLLLDLGATGRLHEPVERLLADPATLAAATRLLLDRHFTSALAPVICDAVGLDVASLVDSSGLAVVSRRRRSAAFTERVLRVYAYSCAACGFDGRVGAVPVAVEAAHVRWHSQHGPDEVANGLALCSLHHTLLDLGVLGLTPDRRLKVSELYIAQAPAGRAVYDLSGRPLASPRPGEPLVDVEHITWHDRQVFRRTAA
ncbi:phosphorothioated DNA-binding restriction endonuclease [Frankia sp. KB5]|uniref:phosphorothioated DNA-binding restriction endonuclease n=1 Tax=Frankia sp. KB5 TaxID=683318 RepID=UPI000A0FDF2B|nr:HNH endonuclease [Frankia sp. KB5]ORT47041.1 restriction endonuclease [Frankia sp. KB5]